MKKLIKAIKRLISSVFTNFLLLLLLTTSAVGSDKQVTVLLYPENDIPQINPVTLTLKGKTYGAEGWFDRIPPGAATPGEKVIVDAINALKHGTWQEVLKGWAPDEQDEEKRYLDNAEGFRKSQSYAKTITASAFLAKVIYGHYEIFVVQHEIGGEGSKIRVYPTINNNGRYFLTNLLKSDPVYQYISYAYAKSLPVKKR